LAFYDKAMGSFGRVLLSLSFARWGVELMIVDELGAYTPIFNDTHTQFMHEVGWSASPSPSSRASKASGG